VRTHGAEGQKEGSRLGFSIAGEKNLMIKIAGCCKPSAGDSIIGYISRGRGIIVHKKACRNVLNIPDVRERMIEVEWESNSPFMTKRFRITARRSTDLFSEIEGAVKKFKGHLIEGRLEDAGKGRFTGFFTMEFEGKDEVRKVVASIRNIPNVINIQTIG
jgi:guanosine-3',5'-bis(diphosphate) 3'-pyrophosphohydrolase